MDTFDELQKKHEARVNALIGELAGQGETLEPAGAENILHVRRTESLDLVRLADHVATLVRVAALGQSREIFGQLRRIVPTFNPDAWPTAEAVGASAVPVSRRAGHVGPKPADRPVVGVAASAPQT